MPTDRIRLKNMRFYAYHGLLPEEASLGQQFEVDLELLRDLTAAGSTDDPADTSDYAVVLSIVKEVVTGSRCQLLEALADRIATAVGQACRPIELIVRVRKPRPPVEAQLDGVEVEIRRTFD